MFHNIPQEMRGYAQWICWRLEWKLNDDGTLRTTDKPTKIPYNPNTGHKASVTNSQDWVRFDDLAKCDIRNHIQPCNPSDSISDTGFSGVGFVLTSNDPYTFIDLDETHDDVEAYNRQITVYQKFNSYSEISPSGKGLHIIVRGVLPGTGRRRAAIELYDRERYMTMTGNVYNNTPIEHRQELVELLYEQMGGPPKTYVVGEDRKQTQTDDEIYSTAVNADNSEKFLALFNGNWNDLYQSQSEADFALVDIIAFYTQNREQIARIFRRSQLGQRDKAKRDKYISYMVEKSFDRQLPYIDIEGIKIGLDVAMQGKGLGEPDRTPSPSLNNASNPPQQLASEPIGVVSSATSHAPHGEVNPFPPGLVGELAAFILAAAPRPVPQIALAGSLALLAGITGRAYNVSGTGLNLYLLLLANTGRGKDAISLGISKAMAAVSASVPAASEFIGPGELVSSAGLIKWLARHPSIVSILGEFGVMMKQMSSNNASAHLVGVKRMMLQLFSKSGRGNVLDPTSYSDREKNTPPIHAPAFTMVGESVPERFYEALDQDLIADGILPRFTIFEYTGKREYISEVYSTAEPSFALVERLSALCAYSLSLNNSRKVYDVPLDDDAKCLFKEFDRWTTDQINEASSLVFEELWNRAHLKALKLAAVVAVGINYHSPQITKHECLWATNLIVDQTLALIAKFRSNQVGDNGDAKQNMELIRNIRAYLTAPWDKMAVYGGTRQCHAEYVIEYSALYRKLVSLACFKNDRMGATVSIKRAIQVLLDAGYLQEMPKSQMNEKYRSSAKAYVVSNRRAFFPEGELP